MQCGNGELRGGGKLLDALHASVVSPALDLGCWFCSMGWTPNSAAVVGPGTAGQGCWTYASGLPWLGNQPAKRSAVLLVGRTLDTCTQGLQKKSLLRVGNAEGKKGGKGTFSPFLLTVLSLLWSHVPRELQSS